MSTDTSVPYPRISGLGATDSALLETLLKDAPIGFAFFAPDLRYQRVNETLAGIYGLAVKDHIGHRPQDVLPEEDAAVHEAALRQVLDEDRAILSSTKRLEGGDGEGRHWALSWFPAHDSDGKISGIALIAVDVTDRQSAEEEVRRSEERYRSLVQASSQIVWVAQPDGEVHEDSPEWRAITGQEPEEYLGLGWLDSVHPDDRERTETAWHEAVRNKSVFDTSYRVRTRSGGYRHFDSRAVPIVRQGEVIEWVGANTDVTSTREADEMRHRLTQQLGEAALRTARLQQATSMLAEALTVEQVVQVITEVGRSSVGVDRSAVALLDRERLRLHLVDDDGVPDESAMDRGELALDEESVMTAAVRNRKPFIAENPESLRTQLEDSPEVDAFLERTDERAWVGLPLLAAGAPLGALRFAFTRPREISEEEKVFLEALGGQCALAVERATLFEREHKTAEALQISLLPDTLPEVEGMALASKYSPGARNVQVGGDWYDAFPLPDGQLAAVLGDVMGKGVKAAAGMSRVRNALRALAYSDPRPAAVLAGLDRVFSNTERDEQVTTLTYLVVDPASGDGFMVNAGHPPPILLAQDAPPRLLTTEPATPLGWPSPRRQHAMAIPSGSTVVLYSDGLVENRRRGLDSGLDELLAVAGQAPPEVVSDPGMLLEYLVDRMLAGYDQDDDVTLLAVHMPPGRP
ncbi:MAG: SpoIIE family protein phosphatase [Streptosporangiales bacterium]|nr:SpoIIE family protein phosphatase [Streptosporangiales bacterium]